MTKLFALDQDGTIFVENDEGQVFGIVSESTLLDSDGNKLDGRTTDLLELNGFELNQDYETELTYIEFTETKGESCRVVFRDNEVILLTHDETKEA